jgi:hypothetical protein
MVTRTIAILAGLVLGWITVAASNAATDRRIYVCHWATPVIFSDRPCGPLAETRVLHVPAAGSASDPGSGSGSGSGSASGSGRGAGTSIQAGPGRASSVAAAPPKEATRPRARPRLGDAGPVDEDDRCRWLLDERRRLDDRMRDGYSSREAARLWNRWREVSAKIYAARC